MTYSLGATGRLAESPWTTNNIAVGDTAGTNGAQSLAMQQGAQVLCRLPDRSEAWFTIDAERSLPGAPVLKRV